MKKILLIVLVAVLCFFAGYFTGIKTKPAQRRAFTPYKLSPVKVHHKLPKISVAKLETKENIAPVAPPANIQKKIPPIEIKQKNINTVN